MSSSSRPAVRLSEGMPGPALALVRRALPERARVALARGYERAVTASALVTGHPADDRRRALRARFFDRAAGHSPLVVAELEGRRVLVPTADPIVGRTTFVEQQAPELALIERAIERSGAARGSDLLEIGANIGTATLTLCERLQPRRMVAIEPEPGNHSLLAANVGLNGLSEQVRTPRCAVSDADGEAELELAAGNSGDHRVRLGEAAAGALGEQARATVTVPVRSVDSLVAEGLIEPARLGLVWIDVQGHEAHVLAGAQRLLEQGVPTVIEVWPYGLARTDGTERLQELVARHFRAFVELPDGTDERPTDALAELIARTGTAPESVADVLLLA